MMRWVLAVGLFLLLCGCGKVASIDGPGSTGSINLWDIQPVSYSFTNTLRGFHPDEGYTWLLLDLEVSNLDNEDNCFYWYTFDDFEFLGADGNEYDQWVDELATGYLDSCFNPGQSLSGFIAFEVPEDIDVTASKLRISIWDDGTESYSLNGLPQR